MSEAKYKFTNEYGLPVLDDSPMTTQEFKAYLGFLEEYYRKEEVRLKEVGILQPEK